MAALSAVEAIQPAWEYTRHYLVQPRRWGTLSKIAAVAFFAEMGGCNGSFSKPARSPAHAAIPWAWVVATVCALFVVILGLFYLSSRLQLVLFDLVLRRQTEVRPSWARMRALIWRWIGVRLLAFALVVFGLLITMLPAVFLLLFELPRLKEHIGALIVTVLVFVVCAFVLILAAVALNFALADFGLPLLVLENASLRTVFARVWRFCRSNPGAVAKYLGMRTLLVVAGGIAGYLVAGICTAVAALPLGLIAWGLWKSLHAAGGWPHTVMIVGWCWLGVVLLAVLVVSVIATVGYALTFVRAYGILFLAGRYPLLDAHLRGIDFVETPPLQG